MRETAVGGPPRRYEFTAYDGNLWRRGPGGSLESWLHGAWLPATGKLAPSEQDHDHARRLPPDLAAHVVAGELSADEALRLLAA